MRILPILVFAFIGATLALLKPAEACVTVTPISPGVVAYDPTSPYPFKERLKLAVRGAPGCGQGSDARIGDLAIGFAERPGQSLQFQIMGPSGNLLSPSAGAAAFETYDFSDAESMVVEFDLKIERGQKIEANSLEFDIVYRTVDEGCNGPACNTLLSNEILPISLAIEPVKIFSLSIAGAARGSVDFGTLETGQSRAITLSAIATAPYQITFDSENDQNLRLDGGSATRPEENVAYAMKLNGVTVTEALPYIDQAVFGTGGISENAELDFSISNATGKRAGKYRDIVTITIQPLMGAAIGRPAT